MPVVLIVDDEPGLLRLFTNLVQRLGCEAIPAATGEVAVELLSQITPTLMILDLAMPQMSGVEVLRAVRSEPRLNPMKVVILTARPTMVPEVEELGIDGWIGKPILPNDFLAIVREVLADV